MSEEEQEPQFDGSKTGMIPKAELEPDLDLELERYMEAEPPTFDSAMTGIMPIIREDDDTSAQLDDNSPDLPERGS